MKERNYAIDLGKYLAALCIIAIHTEPFSKLNNTLNFFSVQIVARLAVPFFAVSSGYFAAKRFAAEGTGSTEKRRAFFGQWKRLILLYAFWTILYLLYSIPNWLRTGWFSAWAFVDFGIAAVRSESHYHLWYLLELIYAWPFFYLCLRFLKRRAWLPLSVFLYGIYTVYYCYQSFLPDSVGRTLSVLGCFSGLSGGIFLILPFLLLGALIAGMGEKAIRRDRIGFVCCFAVLILEASLLKCQGQNKLSYIFLTYPTAFFLFRSVSRIQVRKAKELCRKLGAASLSVYCFHPMVVETLERMSAPHAVRFLVAALLSTLLGLLWNTLAPKWKKRGLLCFR